MPSDVSVIADPANGAAFVAGTRVAMSAVADGALRFGGPAGPVLRPLTFGERTEVVSAASALPAARDAVASTVLAAATLVPGSGSTTLMEVLAMWLAGAAFDGPDFMETTLLVARAAGWPPDALFRAQAREVDRLAVHLEQQQRASEWKSLVFAEAPAETIEAVRARFADRLLRRSAAAAENEESPEERTVRPTLAAPTLDRVAARSSRDAATASESLFIAAPLHATASQTSLSSNPAETPSPERAPAQAATSLGDDAAKPTEDARPPRPSAAASVRGVHLIAPREVPDRLHRAAARVGSVAPRESRPALAFSIRQPRPDATRGVAESTRIATSAVALPLSNTASPLALSGAAAHAVAESMAERVAVVRDLEPHRETRFPERASVSTQQTTPFQSGARQAAGLHNIASHTSTSHGEDLAATLAALLDDEADLRGVER